MKDIIILVVAPLLFAIAIAIVLSIKNYFVATSNNLNDRIETISKRPRAIKDKNHQETSVNKLMYPEVSDDFVNDMVSLFKSTIRTQ